MRFHGEHIGKVLPHLFVKDECNQTFIRTEEITEIANRFDDAIVDNNFDQLYDEINTFHSEEEYKDLPKKLNENTNELYAEINTFDSEEEYKKDKFEPHQDI